MIATLKQKFAKWKWQRFIRKLSSLSAPESLGALRTLLADHRAKPLTLLSVEDRRALLEAVLAGGDIKPVAGPIDHDKVANFSAYERNEWVAIQAAQIPAGALVLDAGAGQGQYRKLFAHTRYESQDFAQYQGNQDGVLQETWDYTALDYVCDITAIPVEAGRFDAVICTEVMEHLPDPVAALKELVRVLKPGGCLLITVPLGSGVHQEPYHFFGGFSPYFFSHHFATLDVEIEEMLPIGGLLKHVGQEMGRVGRLLEEKGNVNSEFKYLLKDWIPQQLSTLDSTYFVDQFTVGYLIRARKNNVQ